MIMPDPDHFDGKKYFNRFVSTSNSHSLKKIFLWMLTRKPARWPSSVSISKQKTLKKRVEGTECQITFIGHSSFLIQKQGLNILTDPVWSNRASPFSFVGPKRVHKPGIAFDHLPPIDIVLVSHNHYDHMDISTLKNLEMRDRPLFYVSKGNCDFLKKQGLHNVEELDWWESKSLSIDELLYFVPAQHFSSRGIFDRNKTLWGGFFMQGKECSIYFAGDTGFSPHFEEIYQKLGAPSLSFLPIGAFEPRSIMKLMHMNPEEAVEAHKVLHSTTSIAMHFGTFQLTDEAIDEPVMQLQQALEKENISANRFLVLQPGQTENLQLGKNLDLE